MVACVSSFEPNLSFLVFGGDDKMQDLTFVDDLAVESVNPKILDLLSLTTTSNTKHIKKPFY